MNKKTTIALAIASAIALSGCNGSSSKSATPAPAPQAGQITVIDGYLSNAAVYVDENGNGTFQLAADKRLGSTNASGLIELDDADADKVIFANAQDGQTQDMTRGTVGADFELSAKPGSNIVSPFTTMVVDHAVANAPRQADDPLQADIAQADYPTAESVVRTRVIDALTSYSTSDQVTADLERLIFTDYLTTTNNRSYAEEALRVMGETIVDAIKADITDITVLNTVVDNVGPLIINKDPDELASLQPTVAINGDGDVEVTLNNRPVINTTRTVNGNEVTLPTSFSIVRGNDDFEAIQLSNYFSDSDAGPLGTLTYQRVSVTKQGLPFTENNNNTVTVDSTTGALNLTQANVEAGEYLVTVTATDNNGNGVVSYPLTLTLNITASDHSAPVISETAVTALQTALNALDLKQGVPVNTQDGSNVIPFANWATDGDDTAALELTINTTAFGGSANSGVSTQTIDDLTLTYNRANDNITVTGTPNSSADDFILYVTANDNIERVTQAVSVEVAANAAPAFDADQVAALKASFDDLGLRKDFAVAANTSFSLANLASDNDEENTLVYEVTSTGPTGLAGVTLAVDASGDEPQLGVSGAPTANGNKTITVTATDGVIATPISTTFTVNVAGNEAPAFSSTEITAVQTDLDGFTPSTTGGAVTDPAIDISSLGVMPTDSDTLTVAIKDANAQGQIVIDGLTIEINASNQLSITGTPTNAGTKTVTLTITDGSTRVVEQAFTFTVS